MSPTTPPERPRGLPPSPAHARDTSIAEAAQALTRVADGLVALLPVIEAAMVPARMYEPSGLVAQRQLPIVQSIDEHLRDYAEVLRNGDPDQPGQPLEDVEQRALRARIDALQNIRYTAVGEPLSEGMEDV